MVTIICFLISYIFQTAAETLQDNKEIKNLVKQWLFSPNSHIQSEAVRSDINLASLKLKTRAPQYLQGVHLLYPTTANPTFPMDVDIILIHGVTGDPLWTWRNLQLEDSQPASVTSTDVILPNILPGISLGLYKEELEVFPSTPQANSQRENQLYQQKDQ